MNIIYRVLGLFPAMPTASGIEPLQGENFAWFILLCCFWCTYSQSDSSDHMHMLKVHKPFTSPDKPLLDSFLYFYRSVITCVSCHMRVAPPLVSYVGKQNLCPLQRLSGCSPFLALPAPHPPLEDMEWPCSLMGRGGWVCVYSPCLCSALSWRPLSIHGSQSFLCSPWE